MNREKAKRASERAALRAQETYRPMMEEPAELPYDDTIHDNWLMSRVTSRFSYVIHIVVLYSILYLHTCLVKC
jgi:hypothetical protein